MKKTKETCSILGVHPNTLRNWANNGKIKYIRQPNGNRNGLKIHALHVCILVQNMVNDVSLWELVFLVVYVFL